MSVCTGTLVSEAHVPYKFMLHTSIKVKLNEINCTSLMKGRHGRVSDKQKINEMLINKQRCVKMCQYLSLPVVSWQRSKERKKVNV